MCRTANRKEIIKFMKRCSHHFIPTKSKIVGKEVNGQLDMPFYSNVSVLYEPICCLCGITPARLRRWMLRPSKPC